MNKAAMDVKRRGSMVTGGFEAWVSTLVRAENRKHALEVAKQRLHRNNFELREMCFHDQESRKHQFIVKEVNSVEWLEVELTECSNQFRVYGKFILELKSAADIDHQDIYNNTTPALSLPCSAISEKPILVIPRLLDHVFIEVEYHSLHWQAKIKTFYMFI